MIVKLRLKLTDLSTTQKNVLRLDIVVRVVARVNVLEALQDLISDRGI